MIVPCVDLMNKNSHINLINYSSKCIGLHIIPLLNMYSFAKLELLINIYLNRKHLLLYNILNVQVTIFFFH